MRVAPWLLAGALAVTGAGCSRPVLRVADASLGDYYTEKEYSKLSSEQREEYCNDLANQDSLYLDEIRESKSALEEAEARRAALGTEVDSLLAEAERREQNIRNLLASRDGAGVRPTPGGAKPTPASDGAKPTPAPDGAKPTPAPDGAANRWSVRRGDSLWRISSREDVYGDGAQWRRIYESNRGRVNDPDRIYPGQELSIPR